MRIHIDTEHREIKNKYGSVKGFKRKINMINNRDFRDLNHFHSLVWSWVKDDKITFKLFHLILKHAEYKNELY